jgi:tetratricopeptide (TPR) repeat protein/predicted aspartyl protease
MRRALLLALIGAGLAPGPTLSAAICTLQKRAELAVTMNGTRPLVHATINGTDALFVADSGAFYSMLTPAAAEEFKLPMRSAPFGFSVVGVGGESARTWVATVKTFGIFSVNLPDVEFLVAGNDFGRAVGLLGQNVLRLGGDVEYDLANGIIRLMSTKDCGKSPLAYWATSQPFSVFDIERATPQMPHTRGVAYLNGQKIRVTFDTGAWASTLTLDAAKRAGITPASSGVEPGGPIYGVGMRMVPTWIATFASFKIGDEEIRNARLRFGAGMRDTDMLIGADFFLSHRVYVANGQQKLYFTYNGGPVFNLSANAAPAPQGAPAINAAPAPATGDTAAMSAAPGAAANPAAAPSTATATGSADQPTDASGFSRRGAAYAARHDFEHAIADFTRACELAPTEASCFYERGMAHEGNNQPELAMADFNQALKLKPDDLQTLLARAELHLRGHDSPAAIADLDAARRSAVGPAPEHMQIGDLYLRCGQFAAAAAQFTLWIDAHSRADVNMPRARGLRCRARAMWGQELDAGISDCDSALSSAPTSEGALVGRGLLRLRRGDYDKAIADFDRALGEHAGNAWVLYARGVAKLRKGSTAAGQADIVAATALDPKIAESTAKLGITP